MSLPAKHRVRYRKRRKAYNAERRYLVLCHYSKTSPPTCNCCGEHRKEFLTLEHKQRLNRTQEERGKHSGRALIDYIIKHNFPQDFSTECYNCNLSRGALGYCPHELERASDAATVVANSTTAVESAQISQESPPVDTSVGYGSIAEQCAIASTDAS